MTSSYFFFDQSKLIAPVTCTICGENAHCIRRQSDGVGEMQTFECKRGHIEMRDRGTQQVSDAAIQNSLEERMERGKI
jgi:hypothetical protein